MSGTETLRIPEVPVCRWRLDCEQPGRNVVEVESLGFKVNTCDDDAADHIRWARRRVEGTVRLTPDPEPEPECYCPDMARRWSAARRREEVPYCPKHGTPEMRGRGEWDQ